MLVEKIPFLKASTRYLPFYGRYAEELKAYTPGFAAEKPSPCALDDIEDDDVARLLEVGRELNFFTLKKLLAFQNQELEASGVDKEALVKKVMDNASAAAAKSV